MKPRKTLETVSTNGGELTLFVHDGDYTIQLDGEELMSSRLYGSESALAELALARLPRSAPARILIGGLGMGFTLRATLDSLGDRKDSEITVAEIYEVVERWNRSYLAEVAGRPLEDPRVRLQIGDVKEVLGDREDTWDAVLLDVDNGPAAFTLASNESLYSRWGLERMKRALAPKGVLAIWAARGDDRFLKRLAHAGFEAKAERVAARHCGKGARHVIFLGQLPR